ncbi:hypothetical protein UFOVP1319_35 [uncultured Caudovirales phage]|uniref:Uncharacterized protein n=1 Tax=uncultured Caudovirales phage TaxID=2100421 RepID=A0A6J5MJB1_9CAUD|nr:hypothetical protein UFOVP478_18 [uncultured Caudovirales phage]CAB4191515.1 hypothetical protein UFOVP1225_45 [uncultured Caudovirales phage]CAB4197810.1 hypothetical protein UFOVP1319_35 [uncultured Caudovirales phage]CAB4217588.1 hypothetical protein UFOVP1591_45 [uncultured Caudovirales phage]
MKIQTANEIEINISRIEEALNVFKQEYIGVLDVLSTIPEECITLCYFYPNETTHHLIINLTTREAFAPLRALRPRWEKSYQVYGEKGVVTYSSAEAGRFAIVCEVGELPPSCTLVETTVTLPAMPERISVTRKIKCNEPKTAEQAAAALKNLEGSLEN